MTDASSQRMAVGVFGAPHGVRGEMRLKSYTGDPLAIVDYTPLTDQSGQRRFVLKKARPFKDDLLIVTVEGVADRDAAARLTNLEVYASRDVMPPAEEDEFYHADLIGLSAVDEQGETLGHVVGLMNFGAGDMLEIKLNRPGPTALLPFTKTFVPLIDLKQGVIHIRAPADFGQETPPPSRGDSGRNTR